jgi:DNA-binding NtrC family response regulator
VLEAASVEEAKALSVSIATIDLIISGVILPGQRGGDLAEYVKGSEYTISTLLISHFHPNLLAAIPGFAAQPEFLQYPFMPEELLARVRRLMMTPC